MDKKPNNKNQIFSRIPDQILERLPEDRLLLYAYLWELETWLREMVYTELVTRYGSEWQSKVEGNSSRAYTGDARLHHMPTREVLSLSYALFSQLRKTISKHWALFREYLPPKDIWTAKLSEIDQIRNRVAHFRRGDPDDLNRVRQLVRDVDKGFWRFCTSYNDRLPILKPQRDPVSREFASLDPFPWTEVEPRKFVRIGHAPSDLVMSVTVELLRRPWLKSRQRTSVIGHHGYLYDVELVARGNRAFEYDRFLKGTKRHHRYICHICLDGNRRSIRLTVPTIAGEQVLIPMLKSIVDAARNTLRRTSPDIDFADLPAQSIAATKAMDRFAMLCPEYVLGPSNPLTFLDPDMQCQFFGAS